KRRASHCRSDPPATITPVAIPVPPTRRTTMSVVAPDWLTRHDGEVRPNPDGHAYLVYFRREPQYLVTPIPAKGKFGCQVTQTINSRHWHCGGTYATAEDAVRA